MQDDLLEKEIEDLLQSLGARYGACTLEFRKRVGRSERVIISFDAGLRLTLTHTSRARASAHALRESTKKLLVDLLAMPDAVLTDPRPPASA